MKRALWILALALTAWLAGPPALANTVTLTGTGPSCLYDSVVIDAAGNVVVNCSKSTPGTPPVVTPPPVGQVCVLDRVRTDFPRPGTSPPFTSQIGVVNSWKLPARSGLVASTTEFPGTPPELVVEWSISAVCGDFNYYKTDAAKITSPRGQRIIVCGGTSGQSGGVTWGKPGSCVIPTGEQWYINLRYISGGQPNTNYTITMGLAL